MQGDGDVDTLGSISQRDAAALGVLSALASRISKPSALLLRAARENFLLVAKLSFLQSATTAATAGERKASSIAHSLSFSCGGSIKRQFGSRLFEVLPRLS